MPKPYEIPSSVAAGIMHRFQEFYGADGAPLPREPTLLDCGLCGEKHLEPTCTAEEWLATQRARTSSRWWHWRGHIVARRAGEPHVIESNPDGDPSRLEIALHNAAGELTQRSYGLSDHEKDEAHAAGTCGMWCGRCYDDTCRALQEDQ